MTAATGAHRARRDRGWFLAAAVLCLLLFGVSSAVAQPPSPPAFGMHAGPFAGLRLYVDPHASVARAAGQGIGSPRVLAPLAGVPQAMWLTGGDPQTAARSVRSILHQAATGRRVPVFVVYDIPRRDCGHGASGGGARSPDEYRGYVSAIAATLRGPAIVVLEPDALAQLDCLGPADRGGRTDLLSWAVQELSARPQVAVYLDAGVRGWQPAETMARRLSDAGVHAARGFALNVSNFDATSAEIRYGRAISSRIGWKRFVIDTSRNGARVPSGQWCNPPGAALGAWPGTAVADRTVDALLWIKHPGESDGACRAGHLPAGRFDPVAAAEMARRAGW